MSYSTPPPDPVREAIESLSQLPRYRVGRTVANDIALPNARVSSQHACLIRCTDQLFVLEDLGSKHGTFVNDVRVTRKLVGPDDILRFADESHTLAALLMRLEAKQTNVPEPAYTWANEVALVEVSPVGVADIPTVPKDPLDFTTEFAALKSVYEQYPKLRKACRDRDKMIRTGSVIVSSVVGVSAVLASGGALAGLGLLQVLSGAGLSMLVPTLCSTLLSTDEKLELIDKEYRERYRCPNPTCRDPFGMREWEQLAQQKTCRRCKAVWVG